MSSTWRITKGRDDDWATIWTRMGSDGTTPVDLTGLNAEFAVYKRDGTTLFLIDTLSAGGITLGGVAGTISMEKDLEGLDAGSYEARLVFIDADSKRSTYSIGEFIIR